MLRAGLLVLALVGCGVRTPPPLDVGALVRAHGSEGARDELVIRIADRPKDVQARLALAALADQLGRPTEAIEQLEQVIAINGPVGPRWHDEDRARLATLLAARGRVRLARQASTALTDLDRASELGATIAPGERRHAMLLLALAELRHVDEAVRRAGMAQLARGIADDDIARQGVQRAASPPARARFGEWLWARGARRAAWDELHAWHDQTPAPRDEALLGAYLVAYAWWTPYDGPPPRAEDLRGPERCRWPTLASECPTPPTATARPDPSPSPNDPVAAYEAAVVAYVLARVPTGPDAAALRPIVAAFGEDPAIAERMGRTVVARSVDAAVTHAALGAMFQALADPARARAEWQAAADSSPELSNLRGLAVAIARAHDPDAALLAATGAAAASGDPALVWIPVSRALTETGSGVEALEAAKSAIDLAGPEAIADAFDCAIAASVQLHRDAQAESLRAIRAALPAAPPATNLELIEPILPAPRDLAPPAP